MTPAAPTSPAPTSPPPSFDDLMRACLQRLDQMDQRLGKLEKARPVPQKGTLQ